MSRKKWKALQESMDRIIKQLEEQSKRLKALEQDKKFEDMMGGK